MMLLADAAASDAAIDIEAATSVAMSATDDTFAADDDASIPYVSQVAILICK